MKRILSFFFLLIAYTSFSQSPLFHVDGSVNNRNLGKPEAGVSVDLVQNGSVLFSATTASNGKYDLKGLVDYSKPFEIVFRKSGLVSKKIAFDYSGVNEEDFPAGDVSPYTKTPIELFAAVPEVDFSFLNTEPVAKFTSTNGAPTFDRSYNDKMKVKIDKLLVEAESKSGENEVKYQAAIKEADKLYKTDKKLPEALAKYEEANSYKPKDEYSIKMIEELDALIQAQKEKELLTQQADSEYLKIIKEADALRDAKKYDQAILRYQDALAKKDEEYPKNEIATLKKAVETDAKYKEAVAAADMFYNQKSYQAAKDKYTVANKLKPTEQHPITRLADIEKKLTEQNVQQEKKKKYDEAIAAGDALFKEEKYEEAKVKYNEAIAIESAATYAIEQVKAIDKILAEKAKEKEKLEKIAKLLKEGGDLLTGNKLPEAKAKYSEVLTLDAENAEAKAKIDEINKKLEDQANQAAIDAKFNKLVTEGDAFVKGTKFIEAKAKYEEALTVKTDAAVQTKLDDVNKKIKELEDSKNKAEKITKLLNEGKELFTAAQYAEAKGKYTEVLGLDAANAEAKAKIDEINKKLEDQANQAALEANFKKLIDEADALFTAEKYTDSKTKYAEALKLKAQDAHATQRIKDIDALLLEQAKNKEKTEKIAKLLKEGGDFLTGNKLPEAKGKYSEVLTLDAENAEAKAKLDEINKKLEDQANQAALDAKFNKLVSEGDAFVKGTKFVEAKTKYEEALTVKTDAAVQAKLDDVNKKLKELEDNKNKAEKITALLNEGKELFNATQYEQAKVKYTKVLGIDAANVEAKAKIDEINKKLQDQANQAALDANFKKLIDEADALFTAEKYTDAKTKYNEALKLKAQDPHAIQRIKDIDERLLALSKDKEKAEKITKLLKEGAEFFTTEKYLDAKAKYTEVLTIDAANGEAKAKLDEIEKKMQDKANQAEIDAKFNKLVADGDAFVKGMKYPDAKGKYEEALIVKKDAAVQAKLDDVLKKIKEAEDRQNADERFNKLKEEGMQLASEEKWLDAKTKLTEALTIKQDQTVVAKLKEIEMKIQSNDALVRLEKEYSDLMTAAKAKEDSKDYIGAIAKYKEAQVKKPSETLPQERISALEALLAGNEKQKAIDEKYRAFIKKGDDLVAMQKYLEAIKEYNEAQALKPNEVEPVEKAKYAEEQEKNKGSEDKKQYEKMISGIQKAILENDLPRGKELVDRAKTYNKQFNIVPNDTRPDDLLAQIISIENADKNFTAKMKEAEAFASSKEYKKAVTAFEEAKGFKPADTRPQQRIDEIKKLLADQSSIAEKEALYQDFMKKGELSQSAKQYEMALSNYQSALSIKANDRPALDKIAEIQQILDDIANKNKSNLDKKNQFDALVAEADGEFSAEKYMAAKAVYQKALAIDNSSAYVKKQIEESDRLQALLDKNLANAEYNAIIKDGDIKFEIKSYDKAKEAYTKALGMRPADPYPKKRLEEIDAILNPKIVKTNALEDLGEPFDNSIMDGYAALVKADLERKSLKDEAVENQYEKIKTAESDLTTEKTLEQQKTTNEIFLLQERIDASVEKADEERLVSVDALDQIEKKQADETSKNEIFKHSENVKSQEVLNVVTDVNEGSFAQRNDKQIENSDNLENYTTEYAERLRKDQETEGSSSVDADQQLIAVNEYMAAETVENFEERKETEEAVKKVVVEAADLEGSLTENKTNDLLESKNTIEQIDIKVSEKAENDSKYAHENKADLGLIEEKSSAIESEINSSKNEDLLNSKIAIEAVDIQVSEKAENDSKYAPQNKEELKEVEATVLEAEKVREEAQHENSDEINSTIDGINAAISEAEVERDLNRQETTEKIHDQNNSIEDATTDAFAKETVKYLKNENEITNQVTANNGITEKADQSHSINVQGVEMLDKKANTTFEENAMSDDEERLKARSDIEIITTNVEERTVQSTEKQEEIAVKVDDVNKAKDAFEFNSSEDQKNKHYDAQTKIDNIESKQPEKAKLANSLGQEYPEGVSQESFTQKDENGLMTAVITRRVVVINGHGTVYVRTQTLHAITYSKDNAPTTEFVWQKETQGPNLVKHY